MPSLSQKLIEKLGHASGVNSRAGKALYVQGVQMTSELARILALPRRTEPHSEDYTELYLKKDAKCSGCPLCLKGVPKFWPIQNAMLGEANVQQGLFAPVGVGHGKTLVSLLLLDAIDVKRAVLLVKPSLRSQLRLEVSNVYGKHFRLPPVFFTDSMREFLLHDGVYVVSYSELSSAKTAGLLDFIKPELVIADEAHNLRHRSAARTKRFLRYMKEHPETLFAALSGTMTTRSILDYAHLIELALRKNSPLPNRWTELQDWSAALDPQVLKPMQPGKLRFFCKESETTQAGYRRRLTNTLGVVATSENTLGSSLIVQSRVFEIDDAIRNALTHLDETWSIGDGLALEELEDAIAIARTARQLSCGFYYRWDWPDNEPDIEWLDARRAWHREVSKFLRYNSKPGLDSPLLLAQAAASGRWKSESWDAWAKVKDRPQPPTQPVWISDGMLADVAIWVADNPIASIIWYQHDALGTRISQELGLPLYGAGAKAAEALSTANPSKQPVIVCSIAAHGVGRNLQAYSANLVTTPPANGTVFEQLLGRTHRPGQMADEVVFDVYLHTGIFCSSIKQAQRDAEYVEITTGQKQKLCYATKIGIPAASGV